MQFIDLAAQHRRIRDAIDKNIQSVLAHGQYVTGPEIRELEDALATFTGVNHAVGCSSGTDALLMTLMAHGVGPGDAVFTTPFTFIATAEVISLLGATPVFVDIDPRTFTIDPAKLGTAVIALKNDDPSLYPLPRTPHTMPLTPKAVIPVDLFGLPADYDAINAVVREDNLFVIEDAAQSLGGTCRGRAAGSLAPVACTSFFPAKPLGCYGDGGMCFTDDDERARVLYSFRNHGQGTDRYDHVRTGINGRLDTIQAAVLLAKLKIFPEEIGLRRETAVRYTALINDAAPSLVTPVEPEGFSSVWAQYSLLARDEKHRHTLMETLRRRDIPTVVYYPRPLHLQPVYRALEYRQGDFPVAEETARRIFSLPMHPYITPEQQELIVSLLRE
ncbi:MAG: aminotransferase DegT [delta proteobacterium MLS_D]|jgi:UDP-2-acetamido-2-deoxy-ribo-hexuluronate aminotransferase|nr:MAG: aminotransferase DegT [delta proteobacterium MLS_D]